MNDHSPSTAAGKPGAALILIVEPGTSHDPRFMQLVLEPLTMAHADAMFEVLADLEIYR